MHVQLHVKCAYICIVKFLPWAPAQLSILVNKESSWMLHSVEKSTVWWSGLWGTLAFIISLAFNTDSHMCFCGLRLVNVWCLHEWQNTYRKVSIFAFGCMDNIHFLVHVCMLQETVEYVCLSYLTLSCRICNRLCSMKQGFSAYQLLAAAQELLPDQSALNEL